MGRRTSAGRSLPGNALGGMLRATQRQARAATRRVARPDGDGDQGVATATPPATPFAGVVETNASGVAHFVFPATLDAAPVVAATVVCDGPATVTVAWVTHAAVALRVWDEYGATAAPGTAVHVVAHPR